MTEVKAEVLLLQLLLLLLLLLLHLLLRPLLHPLLLRVEGMATTTLHPPWRRHLAVAAVGSREAGHGRARITMSSSACLVTSQRMN